MLNKEQKKSGLYNQLKNNTPEPTIFTKEKLINLFNEVFNKPIDKDRKVNLPLEWKYYEWEEGGEKFSCWKLLAGGIFCMLTTGDKGKEEFDKMIKESLDDL